MNFSVYKRYMDAKNYNKKQAEVDSVIANTIKVLNEYTKGSEAESFVAQVAVNALNDLENLRAREKDNGMGSK